MIKNEHIALVEKVVHKILLCLTLKQKFMNLFIIKPEKCKTIYGKNIARKRTTKIINFITRHSLHFLLIDMKEQNKFLLYHIPKLNKKYMKNTLKRCIIGS